MARKTKLVIEIGDKFNSWQVVDNLKKENYNYKHTCKCIKCGRIKEINKYSLLNRTYAICPCGGETELVSRLDVYERYWNSDLNGFEFTPDVLKQPSKPYWFTCSYGHNVRKTLGNFNPSNCPKCINSKLTESEVIEEGSFQDIFPELLEYWNTFKNKIKPKDVACNSSTKLWFICSNGHEFETTAYKITQGEWCPYCDKDYYENKLKAIAYNRALDLKKKRVIPNYPIEWSGKWGINIKLDLVLEQEKKVYEFHSAKHKSYSKDWFKNETDFIELLDIDNFKKNWCKINGYELVIVQLTGNYEKDVDTILSVVI